MKISPRRLFDGDFEIIGLGVSEFVFFQIMRERSEERVIAQLTSQHIEDAGAFLVGVTVHHVFGEAVVVEDYRAAMARPVFAQVGQEVLEERESRLVATARM